MTTAKAAAESSPANAAHPSLRALDRPVNLTAPNAPGWGSDVVAETLRALQIPYIALNPGASYRGLHDSIVNYLGNQTPQMLLCLHEEIAVAPRITTGMRSHQALKIAIVAWNSPTLECTAAAIALPVTLA